MEILVALGLVVMAFALAVALSLIIVSVKDIFDKDDNEPTVY